MTQKRLYTSNLRIKAQSVRDEPSSLTGAGAEIRAILCSILALAVNKLSQSRIIWSSCRDMATHHRSNQSAINLLRFDLLTFELFRC
jgi:hypothetical protein